MKLTERDCKISVNNFQAKFSNMVSKKKSQTINVLCFLSSRSAVLCSDTPIAPVLSQSHPLLAHRGCPLRVSGPKLFEVSLTVATSFLSLCASHLLPTATFSLQPSLHLQIPPTTFSSPPFRYRILSSHWAYLGSSDSPFCTTLCSTVRTFVPKIQILGWE